MCVVKEIKQRSIDVHNFDDVDDVKYIDVDDVDAHVCCTAF